MSNQSGCAGREVKDRVTLTVCSLRLDLLVVRLKTKQRAKTVEVNKKSSTKRAARKKKTSGEARLTGGVKNKEVRLRRGSSVCGSSV